MIHQDGWIFRMGVEQMDGTSNLWANP